MSALTIVDLSESTELTRKAMNAIVGAGRVAWDYLGSSYSYGSYNYTGNSSKSFMGNVYRSGLGWVSKYRTRYQYKQTNYKYNNYYEYFK